MSVCRICLENLTRGGEYHPHCARLLFGTPKVPALDIDVNELHTAGQAMAGGHTTISGVQKKISVSLTADTKALQVAPHGGIYILKPQTDLPNLPENEHVTTRLAHLVGIETAVGGLVALKDGSLAYIVRRFDRTTDGHKVHQEDFCQLSELPPLEKYSGSIERCAKLIQRYATEPLIQTLDFFRLVVFCWWSGNNDMHLKNFSLLIDNEGVIRMTPAYDLLATQLVSSQPFALTVCGKNSKIGRNDWLALAEYCKLPLPIAESILQKQVATTDVSLKLIEKSFLPASQRDKFKELIQEKSATLASQSQSTAIT
jgi:serine/threonine-protein kinase HipA